MLRLMNRALPLPVPPVHDAAVDIDSAEKIDEAFREAVLLSSDGGSVDECGCYEYAFDKEHDGAIGGNVE